MKTMKSLLSFLLLALLSTVATSLDGNGIGTNNAKKGRSNFRRLQTTSTYAPTTDPVGGGDGDDQDDVDDAEQFGMMAGGEEEEELLVSTAATLVTTTIVSEEETNDEVVSTPPAEAVAPTDFTGDETTTVIAQPSEAADDNNEGGCPFCENGMPDLELVVRDAGGKTCAEVKEAAMDQDDGYDDTCTKIIQPLESFCCPMNMVVPPNNEGEGVPPAVAAGDGDEDKKQEEEEVTTTTTTTTTVAADVIGGDEGDDVGDVKDNGPEDEEVSTTTTTTAATIGEDANEFVKDQEGTTEYTTTTTSATSTAAAATTGTTTTEESATSLEACVESAQNAGKDDPLFLCCESHPDNAMCALNKCMDFESQVITCQCQEVQGIAKAITGSNDPMEGYLPEDFDDFLGVFPKCCPSGQVSPGEFNDCYYEEISEEIMEELEEEFEERPTWKPTPRPSSVYIPLTDDEDPITKEGTEDFSNGAKDDSLQGMITTYLDGVESPDEMKSDKNVQVVAISLVVVFLVLLLVTAHLVMDYPDGLCASFCRLILKCLCCLIRVLCLPCRAICCKGSDQTRSRRTHAPMRAPFPSDLELA
mmetsp:Transcript_27301/g.39086  ORF Transcript_27301/g.39086 Transcript_27301/m.39086 type:complete len:587 (+) Transcript_27301:69-1829(+)